jgi:hypothetical protein
MAEPKRRLVERITDPGLLEGISDKPLEELKRLRDECREAEAEISFERRLCQARLDILKAELERRRGGGESDLLARLPEILATEGTSSELPLPSRAPDYTVPRNVDVPRRRVEEIVGEQTLARLPEVSGDELQAIIGSLSEHEQKLSRRRRSVHEAMDAVQLEIVRRYKTGEADPTAALG